jgi:hypothetical protein
LRPSSNVTEDEGVRTVKLERTLRRFPLGAVGWVILVIVAGGVAGALVSVNATEPAGQGPPGAWAELAGPLSIAIVALLVASIIVYARAYLETRARTSLVLTLVFVVFLISEVVGSPSGRGGAADTFGLLLQVIAFAVFLYLGLE